MTTPTIHNHNQDATATQFHTDTNCWCAVTKVNLEQFMTDVHIGTCFTFDTFHKMFRYVNERYFGRTLYTQIKNGQITVDEVVALMKGAM
jgi:hypothetical protein